MKKLIPLLILLTGCATPTPPQKLYCVNCQKTEGVHHVLHASMVGDTPDTIYWCPIDTKVCEKCWSAADLKRKFDYSIKVMNDLRMTSSEQVEVLEAIGRTK